MTTIAILGAGSAGLRHAAAFSAHARVIVVPSRPERAEELRAAGHNTAVSLEDAASLGASACVIATDTGRHAEGARQAFALGLDALIEKPMAVDGPSARETLAAARRSGRKAFVACILRFSESLGRFRDGLAALGAVHAVSIECRSYLPDWRPQRPYRQSYSARAGEGGVLLDLIHEIDYAGWLYGFPEKSCGRCVNLGRLGIDAEESAQIEWSTSAGALVSVGLDYLTRPPRRRMTAFGEHGTLEWDGIAQTTTLLGARSERTESSQTVAERFDAQARAFLAALSGTQDQRLAPLEDGARALEICDAAREGKR